MNTRKIINNLTNSLKEIERINPQDKITITGLKNNIHKLQNKNYYNYKNNFDTVQQVINSPQIAHKHPSKLTNAVKNILGYISQNTGLRVNNKVEYKQVLKNNSNYKHKRYTKHLRIVFSIFYKSKGYFLANKNNTSKQIDLSPQQFVNKFGNWLKKNQQAKKKFTKMKNKQIKLYSNELKSIKSKVPNSLLTPFRRKYDFYKNLHFKGVIPSSNSSKHDNIAFYYSNPKHPKRTKPLYICNKRQLKQQNFDTNKAFYGERIKDTSKGNYAEALMLRYLQYLGVSSEYGNHIHQKGVNIGQDKRTHLHYDAFIKGNELLLGNTDLAIELDGSQHQIGTNFSGISAQYATAIKDNKHLKGIGINHPLNTKNQKMLAEKGFPTFQTTKQQVNDNLKDGFSQSYNVYMNRIPLLLVHNKKYVRYCELRHAKVMDKMHIAKPDRKVMSVIIESFNRNLAFFYHLHKQHPIDSYTKDDIIEKSNPTIYKSNHKNRLKSAIQNGNEGNKLFKVPTVTEDLYYHEQQPEFKNYYNQHGIFTKSNHLIQERDNLQAQQRGSIMLTSEKNTLNQVSKIQTKNLINLQKEKFEYNERAVLKKELLIKKTKHQKQLANKLKYYQGLIEREIKQSTPLMSSKYMSSKQLNQPATYSEMTVGTRNTTDENLKYDRTKGLTKAITKMRHSREQSFHKKTGLTLQQQEKSINNTLKNLKQQFKYRHHIHKNNIKQQIKNNKHEHLTKKLYNSSKRCNYSKAKKIKQQREYNQQERG